MMPQSQKLQDLITLAHDSFYRLVLVIGPSGSGKTEMLKRLEVDSGCTYINLNLELSSRLIDLSEKQRGMQVKPLIADILDTVSGAILLDNIEILFDSALQQNPLLLLQGLSRNRTLVVSWNGSIKDGSLTYAEPGHPEFRKYACKDFLYIDINAD
jgi:adenylate kinase family enzyme